MESLKANLRWIVIALAVVLARPGYSAGAEQPRLPEQAAATHLVLDEMKPVSGPIEHVPDGFAGPYTTARPIWYFQAEALALRRDASGDLPFAALPIASGGATVALGTQNLDFEYRAGGRALVARTLGDWHAMEVCYFGLSDWNEMASVVDATPNDQGERGTLLSPFSDFGNPPVAGLDYNGVVSIRYSSSLDNIEWNLRRRLEMPPGRMQTSVLIGGRYMRIRERIGYHSVSNVPALDTTYDVTTRTDNQMVGVQVGALFEFQVEPRWWIDCEVKGTAFDNRADQDSDYVHSAQGTQFRRRAAHASTFALDLRLDLIYQVSQRVSAYIGYQALWVDGLALASENLGTDLNVFIPGPAVLVDDGRVVYHGPHIGGTLTW